MRYPLIVFDFDGTLADSLGPALASYNRIAPGLGLRLIDDPEAARSMPTRQLLRQLGIRFWRLPRVVRAFQTAIAEHVGDVRLHDGIPEVLRGLADRGHRLGILSSNREDVIRACLRANAIEDVFAFVIGYPKLFGKAKALRRILKHEKAERDGLLFVGDELRDLEAGRKAKVATVAVTWGFQTEPLLRAVGSTYVVRQPDELLAIP